MLKIISKIKDFLWHKPTEEELMDVVYGNWPPIPNLFFIVTIIMICLLALWNF